MAPTATRSPEVPDGSILFLTTTANLQAGVIYASPVDPTTGDVGFAVAYHYPSFNPPPSNGHALAVDSTSSYLFTGYGTLQIQDGALTLPASDPNPFPDDATLLASPSAPILFRRLRAAVASQATRSTRRMERSPLRPAPRTPPRFFPSRSAARPPFLLSECCGPLR